MREPLNIPPGPGRQRTIFIVVVHCRERAPLHIATHELYQAGLEVDGEPLPPKEPDACARWRGECTEPWTQARWGEQEGRQAGLKQHSIRLVRREVLQD